MAIRVLLADDHRVISVALAEQFTSQGMEVVAIESRSEDVIAAYELHRPDVLVLDIRFAPGSPSGLQIAPELLARHPDAHIVFLSQFDDMSMIAEGYRLKALAFVTKSADPSLLVQAIEAAAKGERFFMPAIKDKLMLALLEGATSPKAKLKDVELEVFMRIAKGLTQPEIAEQLGIHRKTVSQHTQSIKEKLGVERPIEIAMMAVKHGMISP